MTPAENQKTKEFRNVFDLLYKKPRIKYTEIAEIFDIDIRIASSRLKEAIQREIIVGPQIRKKSFANLKSYVNFVKSDDPLELYQKCLDDKNVIYHAILDGFCNFQVISDRKMNIKGSLFEGELPDYFFSYPPYRSWHIGIDTIRDIVREFNPDEYVSKQYITNHWNETVEWSEEDEILYQEFKYNLRRPIMHIVEKHSMWRGKAYDFLEKLPECCTIFTCYYPESLSAYDEYVYAFETDYEDFIIDLFSELPTTCCFYKVADKLIAHLQIKTRPLKKRNIRIEDIRRLQIPLLVKDLMKKGIVKNEAHARFECFWRKEVDDI